jgi:hypothetical protein
MPLLFALIGAEVNVEYMESRLIGKHVESNTLQNI